MTVPLERGILPEAFHEVYPSRRSALRLVLTVVEETASGAVPVARVEIS